MAEQIDFKQAVLNKQSRLKKPGELNQPEQNKQTGCAEQRQEQFSRIVPVKNFHLTLSTPVV